MMISFLFFSFYYSKCFCTFYFRFSRVRSAISPAKKEKKKKEEVEEEEEEEIIANAPAIIHYRSDCLDTSFPLRFLSHFSSYDPAQCFFFLFSFAHAPLDAP